MERILVCVVLLIAGCKGYDHLRLADDLLKGYQFSFGRPVSNFNESIDVKFGLILNEVISFDERTSQAKFSIAEYQRWTDFSLRWDPAEYGDVTELHIPASKIWKPDIRLLNWVTVEKEVEDNVNLIVTSDGTVMYIPPTIRTVLCMQDELNEDTVYCSLLFGSWTYDQAKLDIFPSFEEGVSTDLTSMRTEWVLHHSSVNRSFFRYECCPETYPVLRYHLELKHMHKRRKPADALMEA